MQCFHTNTVLGRNEKLKWSQELNDKCYKGNVKGGIRTFFSSSFYIFEPLYYQTCLLNVLVLFFILCIILLNDINAY